MIYASSEKQISMLLNPFTFVVSQFFYYHIVKRPHENLLCNSSFLFNDYTLIKWVCFLSYYVAIQIWNSKITLFSNMCISMGRESNN